MMEDAMNVNMFSALLDHWVSDTVAAQKEYTTNSCERRAA